MTQNEILRHLIARLAFHQDTATEMDYGRIEELCHLIQAAMLGFRLPIPKQGDGPE